MSPVLSALQTAAPMLIKGTAYAMDALSPEARAERKRLRADMRSAETGNLGLSGAEQQSITTQALQNIRGQTRGLEAAALRARAAGGPTVGGETTRTLAALQAPTAQAAATSAANAASLSKQTEMARQQDIAKRIAEKRARRMAAVTDIISTPLSEEEPTVLSGLKSLFGGG